MTKPTENQILGASIRASRDAFEKKHQRPLKGGYEVPDRAKVMAHLSEKFGMTPSELSYYFTYSRPCTHTWASGACHLCPK